MWKSQMFRCLLLREGTLLDHILSNYLSLSRPGAEDDLSCIDRLIRQFK